MQKKANADVASAQCGQHTPTPWFSLSGGIITRSVLADHSNDQNFVTRLSADTTKANREFLLRACNAHDQLVSALKELIYRNELMVGYALRGETETRWTDKQSISRPGELANHDALLRAMQAARAALAQAQKSA